MLFPFLFNVVMEVFSRMVSRAEDVESLNGCKVNTKVPSVLLP